jgi:prepilin-type N-terminal cleavage/methylation domain-containing protein
MRVQRGFSLMELLVVLVVAAVLLAIGAPRIDLNRYKVDAAARQVEGVLQQAQRFAVQRQQDVFVTFDTTTQTIRTTYDANNNQTLDAGERQSVTGLVDGARFVAAPTGIAGGAVPSINGQSLFLSAGKKSVVFHRDGAASSNIEIYLGSTSIPATNLRALSVVQSTGRSQLYRRAGTAWRREGI